jgi:outer membrane protein OmpA-like peptidoglycan-associated protein
MTARIVVALLCSSVFASTAVAKDGEDRRGCQDPKFLSRMPGCWIASCRAVDYELAKIYTTSKRATTPLEGQLEEFRYGCPQQIGAAQIAGNAASALRAAGYEITLQDVYATTRFWVTGKKGPQWVAVYVEKGGYRVTGVKTKELEQVMQATASGWADQIGKTGRASVYGIQFDTGKATLRPDSEGVLAEVAKLFQQNPDWYVAVAGHTDDTGTDAINVPLSRERADAVVAWLAERGVDRLRLTPTGFGARKPLADNASEDGRAKNRRVDIVKLY